LKKFTPFLISIFTLVIFLALYHAVYLPLGKNICDYSGDGIKNLYTFMYHLEYGKEFHFIGLLYPFGDTILYMDAQPFWIIVIKLFEYISPLDAQNPIIYIHSILLFNLFFCAFFVFKILEYFKANILFSSIGAIIITLLSPQIFRFSMHFALGNMAVIPFFWYMYLLLEESLKTYKVFLFAVFFYCVGFIHPYLLLMLAMFFLSFELIQSIYFKKIRYANIALVIIPTILFVLSIKCMDKILDRPKIAWGAQAFSTQWYELLLPLKGSLKELFPAFPQDYTEGYGYIGVFGLFGLFFLIFRGAKFLFGDKQKINLKENSKINLWLFSSFIVLCFALYIPFRWTVFGFDLEVLNPIKQFRGTGRFVFVFYYTFTIYSFVVFSKLFHKNKKIFLPITVILLFISAMEIINYSKVFLASFEKYGKRDAFEYYKEKYIELFKNVNIKDYQCIIPFPPSTEGTEVFWLDADWSAKTLYFWLSYFSGLPLANSHSSRVSLNDCMQIFQLSNTSYIDTAIFNSFKPNKKCLVFIDSSRYNTILPLMSNSKMLKQFEQYYLLSLDFSTLKKYNKKSFEYSWIDSSYKLMYSSKNKIHLKGQKRHKFPSILNIKNSKSIRVVFWYKPIVGKKITYPIIELYGAKMGNSIMIKDWRETHSITHNYIDRWMCVDFCFDLDSTIDNFNCKAYSEDVIIKDFSIYLKL
jgi:hypothetical protein